MMSDYPEPNCPVCQSPKYEKTGQRMTWAEFSELGDDASEGDVVYLRCLDCGAEYAVLSHEEVQ